PLCPNELQTSQIFPLSLHDALPILPSISVYPCRTEIWAKIIRMKATVLKISVCFFKAIWMPMMICPMKQWSMWMMDIPEPISKRSEEHTSELQSRFDLVCRLLLEKK